MMMMIDLSNAMAILLMAMTAPVFFTAWWRGRQWHNDRWRVLLCRLVMIICAWIDIGYVLVFVYGSGVNTAVFRPLIGFCLVTLYVVLEVVAAVEAFHPDYQCRQEIERLNDKIANLLSANDSQQKTSREYQAKVARLEANIGDLHNQIAGMTAEMRSLREELDGRHG